MVIVGLDRDGHAQRADMLEELAERIDGPALERPVRSVVVALAEEGADGRRPEIARQLRMRRGIRDRRADRLRDRR